MKYKINILESVDEINSSRWDKFADFCFMKYDFLNIVENLTLGKEPYYIEILDDNKLIAIAVCYGQRDSLYSSLEESLYGKYFKFVKPFLGLNPSLLCHFPYSPFYQMFKIDDKYNKKKLFEILSKEIEKLAKINNYKSYGFLGVKEEDIVKKTKTLIPVFSGFKIEILINENSIEDYALSLKKSHRHTIRKDIRNFKKSSDYGVKKINKLGKDKEVILNILKQNLDKYDTNKKNEFELTKEFILALDENYDKITYFLGTLKNNIISALMVVEDNLRIVGLRAGQIESEERGYIFYNAALYAPLEYAMENSKSAMELGTGSYKYKIRRGAKLFDGYTMINSTSSFKNRHLRYVLSILDKRNRKKHNSRIDRREE